MTDNDHIVIPHKFRTDRRAVWHKAKGVITFEYLQMYSEDHTWEPDYTILQNDVHRDTYFQDFYGVPEL